MKLFLTVTQYIVVVIAGIAGHLALDGHPLDQQWAFIAIGALLCVIIIGQYRGPL